MAHAAKQFENVEKTEAFEQCAIMLYVARAMRENAKEYHPLLTVEAMPCEYPKMYWVKCTDSPTDPYLVGSYLIT